jgi:hypothetical protein
MGYDLASGELFQELFALTFARKCINNLRTAPPKTSRNLQDFGKLAYQ